MTTQTNNTIKRIFTVTNTTVLGTSPYKLSHFHSNDYTLDTSTVRPFNYDEFLVIGTRHYALDRLHTLTKKQAMRAKVSISPSNQYHLDIRGKVTPITHKVVGTDLINLSDNSVTSSIDTQGNPYFYTSSLDTFELEFSTRRGYSISIPQFALVNDTILYSQSDLIHNFTIKPVDNALGIIGRIGISQNPVGRIGIVTQSPYGEKLFKDLNSNDLPAELDVVQDIPIGQVVKLEFNYKGKLNSNIVNLLSEYYY